MASYLNRRGGAVNERGRRYHDFKEHPGAIPKIEGLIVVGMFFNSGPLTLLDLSTKRSELLPIIDFKRCMMDPAISI